MCKCGESYHTVSNPSKKGNICDLCGAEIFQRADDNEESVQKRLDVYKRQTQPLIDYYSKKGILVTIDGDHATDEVFQNIKAAIAKFA
jgi:adenylate kinase